MNRRLFLSRSIAAGAFVGSGVVSFAQNSSVIPVPAAPAAGTEPKRKPPLAPELVKEFVSAGHGNLPKVKQLLAEGPALINATWDWGAGDWETALGGASHVGNRELVLQLLELGARVDAFGLATSGEIETLKALLRFNPTTASTRGPHKYTLLYHVGYTGIVDLAEAVSARLSPTVRSSHFNQALQTAVVRGHADLVAYLLENGVDNPNLKNFQGKTPLDVATARNDAKIAALLRAKGALSAL